MQKSVATIYFEDLTVERPIYGGFFHLPAVKRGELPFILTIPDHIQMEPQPFIAGGRSTPRVIFGEHIARDVYEHTATMGMGMSVQCGPGVWVVRDLVQEMDLDGNWLTDANGKPRMRRATDEERSVMFADDHAEAITRQERYGEYLIARGDSYFDNVKERILITKLMRDACIYYNREREWLSDLRDGDLKLCVYCMKSIDARAIKCPSCGEIVDPTRHAALLAQRKRLEKETLAIT